MSQHLAFRDAVAQVFRARPNEWLPAQLFMRHGGSMAWRTRISDCRIQLGMAIENKVERDPNGVAQSFYRYQPIVAPLRQPALFEQGAA